MAANAIPRTMTRGKLERVALVAVLGGATGIGFAPILVRLSETGPSATAGLRVLFALPLLWMMANVQRRKQPSAVQPTSRRDFIMLAVAGLFFTADLSIWHWSLRFTSVANSTLLTNFAPVFVAIGAWAFLGEAFSRRFVLGLVLALGGAALLASGRLSFMPGHLFGDALAVCGAIFYAGYLLSIKLLRRSLSTVAIMAWSGLVSCPALFLVAWASGEKLLAAHAAGWVVVLALAVASHVVGQTLIAYALGHLPAAVSALCLLWQPVMAAILAWIVLSEPLNPVQIVGGIIVMAGIFIASQRTAPAVVNGTAL